MSDSRFIEQKCVFLFKSESVQLTLTYGTWSSPFLMHRYCNYNLGAETGRAKT